MFDDLIVYEGLDTRHIMQFGSEILPHITDEPIISHIQCLLMRELTLLIMAEIRHCVDEILFM